MVFSLVRCLTGLENPSQDNAEYINSGIVRRPSLVTSGATLLGITMNSRLGTKCGAPHFAPLLLRPLLEFSPHIPSTHVIAVAGPPKNRDFISTLISILWFTDPIIAFMSPAVLTPEKDCYSAL